MTPHSLAVEVFVLSRQTTTVRVGCLFSSKVSFLAEHSSSLCSPILYLRASIPRGHRKTTTHMWHSISGTYLHHKVSKVRATTERPALLRRFIVLEICTVSEPATGTPIHASGDQSDQAGYHRTAWHGPSKQLLTQVDDRVVLVEHPVSRAERNRVRYNPCRQLLAYVEVLLKSKRAIARARRWPT